MKLLIHVLPSIIFFSVHLLLQVLARSFLNESGAHPDEAAHYVSGMMVRDYIAAMDLSSPIRFAENYYIHYPKIAIGHWPPLFYVLEGVWMLIFSVSRVSVLLMVGLIVALMASTVFQVMRREFGNLIAIISGLLVVAAPIVQLYSGMIMLEPLVAALSLWATLCFGRYIHTEKVVWSIGFGIFASLAIMTKGNGLALALIPGLAIVLCGRFNLIKRLSTWWPLAIVAVVCGPWYWVTLPMIQNGMRAASLSIGYTLEAIPFFAWELIQIGGIGISIVVVIGLYARLIRPAFDKSVSGIWAAAGALLLGTWIFHCLSPAALNERYLVMSVPVLAMFFGAGCSELCHSTYIARFPSQFRKPVVVGALALVFAWETFSIPTKAWNGFGAVADELLSNTNFENSVMLISSDSRGEGMFVAEIAERDTRPSRIVLRGSKVLARSRWGGSEYELLYDSTETLMTYLDSVPVGIVIADRSMKPKPYLAHNGLLRETIKAYSGQWELLGAYSIIRKGVETPDAVEVFRLRGHESQSVNILHIDMEEMLGRVIEKQINTP